MRKLLVYIAAPYTHPDPIENTHIAIQAWKKLHDAGIDAIVPHTTLLLHLMYPSHVEVWYGYDMTILEHCDAVIRLKGASVGADKEIEHADECEIPVFKEIDNMSLDSTIAKIVQHFVLENEAIAEAIAKNEIG